MPLPSGWGPPGGGNQQISPQTLYQLQLQQQSKSNDFNWGGDPNGANARAQGLERFGTMAEDRQGPQADYSTANADYAQNQQDYAQSQQMRGRESSQADYLQSVMNGTAGPNLAEQQLQHGTDQSIAAQMALAHSASGAGPALAAAQHNASVQGGQMQTQNVQATGLMRAQEQAQARQEYSNYLAGIRGQDMQSRGVGIQQQGQSAQQALSQAQLEAQQRALNDQTYLGSQGLANQTDIAQLGARGNYQQLMAGIAAQQQAQSNAMLSGYLGAAATVGGAAMMSDERNKMDIASLGSSIGSAAPSPYAGTSGGEARVASAASKRPSDRRANLETAMDIGRAVGGITGGDAGLRAFREFVPSDIDAKYDMIPLGPHGDGAREAPVPYEMHPAPGGATSAMRPDLYEALVSDERAKYGSRLMPQGPPNRPMLMSDAHAKAEAKELGRREGHADATAAFWRAALAREAEPRYAPRPAPMPTVAPFMRAAMDRADAGGPPPGPGPYQGPARPAAPVTATAPTAPAPVPSSPMLVASDERTKQEIHGTPEVNHFLEELHPYSFHYKPGVPGEDPREDHYGIMAQDAERSRMGRSFVKETPIGKELDTRHGFGTLLAAQASEHRRIDALERGLYSLMGRGR